MEGLNMPHMVCMDCGKDVEQVEGGWDHVDTLAEKPHAPQPVTEVTYRMNMFLRG